MQDELGSDMRDVSEVNINLLTQLFERVARAEEKAMWREDQLQQANDHYIRIATRIRELHSVTGMLMPAQHQLEEALSNILTYIINLEKRLQRAEELVYPVKIDGTNANV